MPAWDAGGKEQRRVQGMLQCDWGGHGQRSEEVVNINKKHFLMIGSSFGVPWFVLGSSLVFYREGIREVQRKRILKFVHFAHSLEDATESLQFRG